jgi:hypothetical protein
MSFPELEVLDGESAGTLKNKEAKAIRDLFKDPDLCTKAQREFDKRPKK